MATKLFSHAFYMLWNNLGNAARVSIVPFISLFVAVLLLAAVTGGLLFATGDLERMFEMQMGPSGPGILIIAISVIVFIVIELFAIAWAMVGWHRFVLLEDQPISMFPKWNANENKAYVQHLLRIIAVLIVAYIVIAIVAVAIVALTAGIGLLLFIPLLPFLLACFLRISLGLPSRAIGQKLKITEGLAATENMGASLYWFACLFILFGIAIGIVGTLVSLIPILGVIAYMVLQWFNMMFNASVITTLYGHAIEGRELG